MDINIYINRLKKNIRFPGNFRPALARLKIIISEIYINLVSKLKKIYKPALYIFLLLILPYIVQFIILKYYSFTAHNDNSGIEAIAAEKEIITKEIDDLNSRLDSKTPKSFYLVVNSTINEFSLFKGKDLVKSDKCSTGSYIMLRNKDKNQWLFKTPKGEFKIRNKTVDPVWKKPDWAFIEEGLPVPSPNHSSRFEYGVLGDYALHLGDGYMIHGTLYQRFLGLAVTHGCIRLNDENLKLIYKSLSQGSKVYIY